MFPVTDSSARDANNILLNDTRVVAHRVLGSGSRLGRNAVIALIGVRLGIVPGADRHRAMSRLRDWCRGAPSYSGWIPSLTAMERSGRGMTPPREVGAKGRHVP